MRQGCQEAVYSSAVRGWSQTHVCMYVCVSDFLRILDMPFNSLGILFDKMIMFTITFLV